MPVGNVCYSTWSTTGMVIWPTCMRGVERVGDVFRAHGLNMREDLIYCQVFIVIITIGPGASISVTG